MAEVREARIETVGTWLWWEWEQRWVGLRTAYVCGNCTGDRGLKARDEGADDQELEGWEQAEYRGTGTGWRLGIKDGDGQTRTWWG